MTAILTVVGRDRVGITAAVANILAENGVNIVSISQTILDEYFTMMMKVDLAGCTLSRPDLVTRLNEKGATLGMQIHLIHEGVLQAMHRI